MGSRKSNGKFIDSSYPHWVFQSNLLIVLVVRRSSQVFGEEQNSNDPSRNQLHDMETNSATSMGGDSKITDSNLFGMCVRHGRPRYNNSGHVAHGAGGIHKMNGTPISANG